MSERETEITGRAAMEHIARSGAAAVLLTHDRTSGDDRIIHGQLLVTESGYAFKKPGGDHQLIGSGGDNAWTTLLGDPWVVGLRTPSEDRMIAAREPSPEEYDEWREIFEDLVRQ